MKSEALALDLGSQKVVALWGTRKNPQEDIEILGVGVQHHRNAFRFGEVIRPDDAAEAIERALQKALKKKKKIKNLPVHVAVSGRYYSSKWLDESNNISKGAPVEITEQAVRELLHIVMSAPPHEGRVIFRFYPFEYLIDHSSSVPDPVGMMGRSLKVYGLAAYAQETVLTNLESLLQGLGFSDRLLTFEYQPVAASYAVLSEGDRRENLLVLDMGYAKVDFAFWYNGGLRLAASTSEGCYRTLTEELKKRFQISREKAGELLSRLGNLHEPDAEPQEIHLALGGQGITREIPRRDAVKVVQQSLDRMVARIQRIQQVPVVSGVVVVGGLARLPGLLKYLETKFRVPVLQGEIQGVRNLPGREDPGLAVAVGTLKLALQQFTPARRRRRSWIRRLMDLVQSF